MSITHIKRELSGSVFLEELSLSDKIKRLAISVDGMPNDSKFRSEDPKEFTLALRIPDPPPIFPVMSSASDSFAEHYVMMEEIGRGGFSTVYKCQSRVTGAFFAVKVVDLRPLRLRERFNPARIRREVDIMKRLRHPNIIQFVDVFESSDQLMMVMEYCPGEELFDVILAKNFLSERDAKPIFAQIARALFYLHNLNIIHRDVKPENVLVLHAPDTATGLPIAKLLDFGLSKNAGAGSAAKTFVGTPCYLAPEVEYTSKGLGGTYGLPADCWSLGAVLYVMLVARFPEFEMDATGKVVLRLPPALWDDISSEAKDLIRSLMNTNPMARMTARGALQHPWLGPFRATPEELSHTALGCYDLGQGLQAEEEALAMKEGGAGRNDSFDEVTSGGMVVHTSAMVLRTNGRNATAGGSDLFPVSPLLNLQRSIATCFEEAHSCYEDLPEVATQVRKGADLCRQQLTDSTKMLTLVEQTSIAVLGMFPDLELAMEENEPGLASNFFNVVRGWVTQLRDQVTSTQRINRASMDQIQSIVEESTHSLRAQGRAQTQPANMIDINARLREMMLANKQKRQKQRMQQEMDGEEATGPGGDGSHDDDGDDDEMVLSQEQLLELFMGMFGQQPQFQPSMEAFARRVRAHQGEGDLAGDADSRSSLFGGISSPEPQVTSVASSPEKSVSSAQFVGGIYSAGRGEVARGLHFPSFGGEMHGEGQGGFESGKRERDQVMGGMGGDGDGDEGERMVDGAHSASQAQALTGENKPSSIESVQEFSASESSHAVVFQSTHGASSPTSSLAAKRLAEALEKLHQVDQILEHLSVFWANTEVVLDVLTKKGQHVEQFIGFSAKPRLLARFKERMEEYKRFWEKVNMSCNSYIAGIQQQQLNSSAPIMYGFLQDMEQIADSGMMARESSVGQKSIGPNWARIGTDEQRSMKSAGMVGMGQVGAFDGSHVGKMGGI